MRADHDGRGLRGRGPGALLRSRRGAAGRGRQPSPAGGRRGGDGPAERRRSRHDQGFQTSRVSSDAGRRSVPLRARPVRRLPRHRRRRAGFDHRDIRRPAPVHRLLAVARRAVLHPDRQAPRGQGDRAAAGVQASPAPSLPSSRSPRAGAESARVQDRSVARDPAYPRRRARRQAGSERDRLRSEVRRGGRRGCDAVRGAAPRGAVRGRRLFQPAGQRRGVLADRRAAARTRRPRCSHTRRARGDPRRRTSWSPATAAGALRGCPIRRASRAAARAVAGRARGTPRPGRHTESGGRT